MDERIFFEYGDVKVTNSRFINGGQTYAMNNVTSVKPYEKKPSRTAGVIVLLIGIIIMVNSSLAVGLIISAVAAYYLYQQKTIYHILLSTSAGETTALVTYQRHYLNDVIAALNNAIIHRG
ncbi:hypothetical protein HH213_17800 [Duganella dendranthematis]|uniref:QacE n=1 Tax=Duganella dendranthematis TaxID=2728021 RepID=A0ABX6MBR1_9BURK|nr:DUF6232 family protein [Duganella dendranthematis]QJD91778.1 hypothetical protein HH213_17800 [Duganella dendranthematis]